MEQLQQFEAKWGVSPSDPHKVSDIKELIDLSYNVLDLSSHHAPEYINDTFNDHIEQLVKVYNDIKADSLSFELEVRINRLLELVYYSQNVCVSLNRMNEVMDLSKDFRDNTDASLFRFRAIDQEVNSKFQNFLLFILGVFYKNKFARYNGDVYKLITSTDGYNTRAWKRFGSISEIIYKQICKETNYEQFLNVTHRGDCVETAANFLSKCSDNQFPQLVKDRRVFSFSNGIYFAKEDTFVSYDSDEYSKVPTNVVSAKYFPHDFSTAKTWQEIDTPYFDSIFKHQNICDDILQWVYVFTGRLIYELDEMDGWQVIFFVQGQAGTGKSTYANNICKQLYEEEDVGIMSNNFQRTFGLSDLVDKMIFVAPEIKRDFNIEQGEFQSIISGDKITINIKCKKSRFENWTIPGVLAGNECPDFIDNAGSIQRRIVPIRFTQKVTKGDLNLGTKLKGEMPAIIQKCNKAYLEAASQYGRDTVWSILPKYFIQTQQELAKSTNSLTHFLLSDSVVLDPSKYIPEDIFKQAFNDHNKANNYTRQKWNQDFYMGPFAQYNISVVKNDSRSYNGRIRSGTFFVGLDMITNSDIYDDFSEL